MPYLTQRHFRISGAEGFGGSENRTERKIDNLIIPISPPGFENLTTALRTYLLATPLFSVHVWRRYQHVHYTATAQFYQCLCT